MDEQLDNDHAQTAEDANTYVADMREELTDSIETWKAEVTAANEAAKNDDVWVTAFYAQDTWDALDLEVEADINGNAEILVNIRSITLQS